jgi:hypothetical protein
VLAQSVETPGETSDAPSADHGPVISFVMFTSFRYQCRSREVSAQHCPRVTVDANNSAL